MLTVRSAEPGDAAALAGLLRELDEFYGAAATAPNDAKAQQINSALFADPPLACALLACDGPSLAGMAAYSFLWPAARATKSLYLKELYVPASCRGRGVGTLLMTHILKVAADNDCSRVEWTTDRENTAAQRFYEQLGLTMLPTKLFYRAEIVGGRAVSS
jgi:ribosomal protein S18 acetylase RimI-like enzyme